MAIPTDIQWIALRLPAGASFAKNGVELSVEEAIQLALDSNDGDRQLALADLLEILAADVTHKVTEVDGEHYEDEALTERASQLRDSSAAAQGGNSAGSFQSVPLKR